MVMVSAFSTFGFAYLCLAFAALDLFTFLDLQCGEGTGTGTSAEAPLPLHYSKVEVLPPLATLGLLFVAVALTYRHLMMGRHVAAPVAGTGNGRRSISRLVMLALCVSAGTLEFILFGQAAVGGTDRGALGLAALRALPAVATGTFLVGMMLIIVALVRAGGEGGGTGGVAGDGDEPIQGGLLLLLAKVAVGMAAALVGLMLMALAFHGAKY